MGTDYGIVELWSAKDVDPGDTATIELMRFEREGIWQIFLGGDLFSGYPAIYLDRKNLKDLHEALEMELYPERFQKNVEG